MVSVHMYDNYYGYDYVMFNGWQLAKMKKSIPDMYLPWNL